MASDDSRTKLSTSREIISRILWDSRLNRAAFRVGYQDRLAPEGFREKTVDEWAVASDIPWHRVRFVRCGETRVWDRETHLDLFATDELPAAAWVEPPERISAPTSLLISETPSANPDFACVSRPVFQNSHFEWNAISTEVNPVSVDRLKIITFNILAQLPDDGDLRTPERTTQLLLLLQSSQADVIALQEVTPTVLAALQTADWTAGWFLSEPILSPNLDPHGVLVLSRYPFSQVDHWFSLRKRVLIATWTLNDQPLHIAVLHLPSSMTSEAPARRRLYTGKLVEYLSQLPGDCAVVGDFNTPGDELDQLFQHEDFDDLWPRLNPTDPGLTYDPVTNDLAAQLSRSGNSSRYDRMWVRSKNWRPTQIARLGVEPVATPSGPLFLSDHFGLDASFEQWKPQALNPEPRTLLQMTAPVYTSAIV
ncbi:MAG TPA: RNA repair domain-containing protein, partial [Acidobacteriota bacterium]|nr:RNA repair domain-containing protein [Acidobacteriota bacterium]